MCILTTSHPGQYRHHAGKLKNIVYMLGDGNQLDFHHRPYRQYFVDKACTECTSTIFNEWTLKENNTVMLRLKVALSSSITKDLS